MVQNIILNQSIIISAVGQLNRPSIPRISGIENLEIQLFIQQFGIMIIILKIKI